MIIRLRSRDGLERIQMDEKASVGDLKQQISAQLGVREEDQTLSLKKELLTSKSPQLFADLATVQTSLQALGGEGLMVYLWYPFARTVEPSVKPSVFGARAFGEHMSVDDLLAKQTRIERQEVPHCASVSFERHAANMFQQYVHQALAFSIKRGGFLYGSVDEQGNVSVEAIYEPPQAGSSTSLVFERGGGDNANSMGVQAEEQLVDYIADQLGLKKVGWIFSQSTADRDFIMSVDEIKQISAMQDEIGKHCVTGLVGLAVSEEGSDVHFEAFQVSDQCVRLVKDGWMDHADPQSGVSKLTNPKEPEHKAPVIVASKDVAEVDNDYFLIPIKILDHEGPLSCSFPIENRLLPQGKPELRLHMAKNKGKPYVMRIADFHLLLYLAKQPNFDLMTDMAVLCECVKEMAPVPEGYTMILDALAG